MQVTLECSLKKFNIMPSSSSSSSHEVRLINYLSWSSHCIRIMKDQISYPYKTTDKIMVLYALFFSFLLREDGNTKNSE